MILEQCWQVARAWYPDRLKLHWRRMTADEMRAVFTQVGLSGEFWRV